MTSHVMHSWEHQRHEPCLILRSVLWGSKTIFIVLLLLSYFLSSWSWADDRHLKVSSLIFSLGDSFYNTYDKSFQSYHFNVLVIFYIYICIFFLFLFLVLEFLALIIHLQAWTTAVVAHMVHCPLKCNRWFIRQITSRILFFMSL